MNCLECQENLVAYVEHLLDPQTAAACQCHLADCPACRQQRDAIARLQRQLVTHGEAAASVALAGPVMSRIRVAQPNALPGRRSVAVLTRWLLGLGAAAAVFAVAALFVLMPNSRARAADVMTQGAKVAAQLTSVHLQGRMRTPAADNFSYIDPAQEFTSIELWKELGGLGRWRIEKPGRVAAMDGQSTTLFIRSANTALRLPQPARSAFDTDWLHRIADLEKTLSSETRLAQTKGWPMTLTHETVGGATKAVVTIEEKSGLPAGDYLQNKFLGTADTRGFTASTNRAVSWKPRRFMSTTRRAMCWFSSSRRSSTTRRLPPACFKSSCPPTSPGTRSRSRNPMTRSMPP
jgi:hypothetical protein